MKRTLTAIAFIALFLTVTALAQAGETYAPCTGNLIKNGNFESGNQDFITDYTYVAENPSVQNEMYPPKTYSVGTDPNLFHDAWTSFKDHTSGAGNMLIVNAACVSGGTGCDETTPPSKRVWEQTVAVKPGTKYRFSYWIALSFKDNPPELMVSINGKPIGTDVFADHLPATGEWRQVSYEWFSGSATEAKITIVDQAPVYHGDDYALDDIELCAELPCVTAPLMAGQKTDVGSVSAYFYEGKLYVTYNVTLPWCFTELHLAVTESPDTIPQTKTGNPIPGRFPYHYNTYGKCETSYTFPAIEATCPLYIAAHAAVQNGYQYETAWGKGTRFVEKGNWGMWFTADECCTTSQPK